MHIKLPEPSIATISQLDINASFQSQGGILNSIYQYLQHISPTLDGYGYMLTTDNNLASDCILQTPNVWGMPSDQIHQNAGIHVAQEIFELIASAEQFVDITTLCPFPTGEFFQAIQNALIQLAHKSQPISIRILCGWYPQRGGVDQISYLRELIAPLVNNAPNLHIYVATQRTSLFTATWNHSKIVAVDGKRAILGGENLWDANYLGPYPVHDLNMKVSGPSAFYMHRFVDLIWKDVCNYSKEDWKSVSWSQDTGIIHSCLSHSLSMRPQGVGQTSILGIGRYGGDDTFKSNPADAALVACFNAAQKSIYISQQDLGNMSKYWEAGLEAIANAILRGIMVRIVISNDFGKASATRDPQSSKSDAYHTATQRGTILKIWEYLIRAAENTGYTRTEVESLFNTNFEVAVLRFGPSDYWPNGWEFANHAKFIMVDETVFYVGSENLYPANLIEYGVLIDDPATVVMMHNSYWNQLWHYSSRTALRYVI